MHLKTTIIIGSDTWSIASRDLYEGETFVYINTGEGGDLFFAGITSLQTLVKAKF